MRSAVAQLNRRRSPRAFVFLPRGAFSAAAAIERKPISERNVNAHPAAARRRARRQSAGRRLLRDRPAPRPRFSASRPRQGARRADRGAPRRGQRRRRQARSRTEAPAPARAREPAPEVAAAFCGADARDRARPSGAQCLSADGADRLAVASRCGLLTRTGCLASLEKREGALDSFRDANSERLQVL